MLTIENLFHVEKGKGEYRENLEKGETPLVSATNNNNGIIDYVKIEPTFSAPAITIERVTGQAFVQLFDFASVPDDISVLIPKEKMTLHKLFYIASQINLRKWKFNYARKATPPRLKKIEVDLSSYENIKEKKIDFIQLLPPRTKKEKNDKKEYHYKTKLFSLTDICNIERKYAPYLNEVESTDKIFPYITTTESDNGISIRCDTEPNFTKNSLTIALDGTCGVTFYQFEDFISGEKTAVLTLKEKFDVYLMFYLAYLLRRMSWRYSYGRKLSIERLKKFEVQIPVTVDYKIDYNHIKEIVENCYGWNVIKENIIN